MTRLPNCLTNDSKGRRPAAIFDRLSLTTRRRLSPVAVRSTRCYPICVVENSMSTKVSNLGALSGAMKKALGLILIASLHAACGTDSSSEEPQVSPIQDVGAPVEDCPDSGWTRVTETTLPRVTVDVCGGKLRTDQREDVDRLIQTSGNAILVYADGFSANSCSGGPETNYSVTMTGPTVLVDLQSPRLATSAPALRPMCVDMALEWIYQFRIWPGRGRYVVVVTERDLRKYSKSVTIP